MTKTLTMLRYAEAKNAFDNSKDKTDLKGWERSPSMKLVERNTFDIRKERFEAK